MDRNKYKIRYANGVNDVNFVDDVNDVENTLHNGKNGRNSQEKQNSPEDKAADTQGQSAHRHNTGHRNIFSKIWMVHTITEGDTLYQLAEEYKSSVSNIIKHNRGLDPRQLVIGDRILIPPCLKE